MTQHSPLSRRTLIGCLAAALIAGPAFAQQIDINGVYDAQGRNPDGSAYSGQATVAEQSGAVEINWIVGNQHYKGTRVRDGQVVMVNFGVPALSSMWSCQTVICMAHGKTAPRWSVWCAGNSCQSPQPNWA